MSDYGDEPPPHVKAIMEQAAARAQKKPSNGDYEVGHGKPPKHTRFKKGEPSANPKGRPRKDRRFQQSLEEAFSKKVSVKMGGKIRRMTANEIMIQQLINAVAKSEPWAIKEFIRIQKELEPFKDKQESAAELEKRRELSAKIVQWLNEAAAEKKGESMRKWFEERSNREAGGGKSKDAA